MDHSLRNVQKISVAYAAVPGDNGDGRPELIAEVVERFKDGSSVSYLADTPALQCIIAAVTQGDGKYGRLRPTPVGWTWVRSGEDEEEKP